MLHAEKRFSACNIEKLGYMYKVMYCTAVCVNLANFESPTVNNACVQNKILSTQHRDLNFEHAHTSFVDHTKIARFTQTAVCEVWDGPPRMRSAFAHAR